MVYYYRIKLGSPIPHGTPVIDKGCVCEFRIDYYTFRDVGTILAWPVQDVVTIRSEYPRLDVEFYKADRSEFTVIVNSGDHRRFVIADVDPLPVSRNMVQHAAVGGSTTELDQILSNLAWADEWKYGTGVDAVTGKASGSALKPPASTPSSNRKVREDYSFIENKEQLERQIDTALSGKYNIEGVTVNASTSFINKLTYSTTSLTLLATYEYETIDYEEIAAPELNEEARKLSADPGAFRKAFGDYFVAGARTGSKFQAIYQCNASSEESLNEFKLSMGASAPAVFTAEGALKFKQAASSNRISISVDVEADGSPGNLPKYERTPEGILGLLEWFKENEVGRKLRAKLKHYSTIDTAIPRIIDVSPDAFAELRLLYNKVWDVRARYASCPGVYKRDLERSFYELDHGVVANQATLAHDAESRVKFIDLAYGLSSRLDDIYDRKAFYLEVLDSLPKEPAKGTWQWSTASGQRVWKYGYDSCPSDAVVIHRDDQSHRSEYKFWDPVQSYTFEFGPDGKRLIVGWEIRANWPSNDGIWEKAKEQILLTDYSSVHVQSEFARGFSWSATVYYVDAKDYQFKQADQSA